MRWPLALVLVACASAPSAPLPPPPTPAPPRPAEPFWTKRAALPEDPPLVALATERVFYLLATEDFGPACRGWKVVQSKQRGDDTAYLVEDPSYDEPERIGFVNHGARLELVSRTRGSRAAPTCDGVFSVSTLDGGDLDVSGARWFARADACERARRAGDRVATDLSACALPAIATLQQQARSQRAFEATLRFGGTLFEIADDACRPLRVEADRRNTATYFAGHLWTDLRDGRRRGKTGHGYQLAADALTISLLGPTSTWSDGASMGLLCGSDHALAYGVDHVEVASTIYLSARTCRAALAQQRTQRARLPETGAISSHPAPRRDGC